ncbi:MAG: energy transducer TonB [Woeseiaceae bacterium]
MTEPKPSVQQWSVRQSIARAALVTVGALLLAPAGQAQLHDTKLQTEGGAVVIDQALPDYPGHMVRNGQEGWVWVSYVVSAAGRVIDPIIMDSSGGPGFETAIRDAMEKWRFEPPASGEEIPLNSVAVRSEIYRGRDAATSNFIRRYRRIVTHLHFEEYAEARKLVDETYELGGWNLYESAMLWLMIGRVDGAEGDLIGKLEAYRRALAIATRNAIGGDDRRELLSRIFELEDRFGQYASAVRTFNKLEKELDNSAEIARFGPRAREILALMQESKTLSARATIYNPCDCDTGQPLWTYRPARRTFSFANLSGNVIGFEARCETKRIHGNVEVGPSWTLAPGWGSCRVFVLGEDGASFDFVEHLDASQDESAGETVVARSHVLD